MLKLYVALWLVAFAANVFVLLRVPLTTDRRSSLIIGPLVMAAFAVWWINDAGFRWNLMTVMTLGAAYALPVVARLSASPKPRQDSIADTPESGPDSFLSRLLTRDILPATTVLDLRVTWAITAVALLSFAASGRAVVVLFEAPVFVWWLLTSILVGAETGDRRWQGILSILLIVFVVAWWPLLKPASIPIDPGFAAIRVASFVAAPLVARWFMRRQLLRQQADGIQTRSGV